MTAPAVCLVMLLDASASVDDAAWRLMLNGHAEAFRTPAIVRAAEQDGLAVMAIQYSDAHTSTGWRVLRTAADAAAFAGLFHRMSRDHGGGTNTGRAMLAALDAMDAGPACEQHVIDVATDGPANDWDQVRIARERAQHLGVRVNALGIVTHADPNPEHWLRAEVITADGFAIVAQGWGDFARAVARKLVMEVSAR